ncbi:hypothetical protein [Muricoccus radiodurans]|uniref:hypothetical protein n=1 Tax=Muricoccus radiodurans TaxID=2231721 RepID=UPI003CEB85BF
MLRQSQNAVVARNETWSGECATEPHEVGWAAEAVIFVRALAVEGDVGDAAFRVQLSPDGMRWVDEGTTIRVPARQDETGWARVAHFGAWLRITAVLPPGVTLKPLVTFSLKA